MLGEMPPASCLSTLMESISTLPRTWKQHLNSYKAMWERTERFLWIDAICIDQFDLSERDTQVQRMRSIYEQAEKVIIWLRIPATPTMSDAHSASELMKYLSALFEMSILTLDWGKGSKIQNAFLSLGDPDMICDGKIWTYLSSLFKSSWFERLWVIQELAASKDAVVL
ncbi:heterokaryon incompatibility [Halenospora varia]|nr:heterokaryon incompatibility [Halenospora varia]